MPISNLEKRKIYHREYMREYNKTHALTPEQKMRKLDYMKTYSKINAVKISKFDSQYRKKPSVKYKKYTYDANKRGLEFTLTSEDFNKLLTSNCFYCGKENANGVDRVNNLLGYYSYNVVACCKTCNYMKLSQTYDEFVEQIKKIVNHLKLKT